jgi:hypothetical protein
LTLHLDKERLMTVPSWLKPVVAGISFQAVALFASVPPAAADGSVSQAILAGEARVWFLREFDPALSSHTATIYANGVAIGESRPGTVFTVDLTPGVYTFTVPNDLPDGSQPLSIELTAGTQVYFNVDANEWVDMGEQEQGRYIVNVREISAALAARYFPALTMRPHN